MSDLSAPVWDAFWNLIARHAPIRYGKDKVCVSPEAGAQLWSTERYGRDDLWLAVSIDSRLRGTEMRLERKC